jgi:hypothetical protein
MSCTDADYTKQSTLGEQARLPQTSHAVFGDVVMLVMAAAEG